MFCTVSSRTRLVTVWVQKKYGRLKWFKEIHLSLNGGNIDSPFISQKFHYLGKKSFKLIDHLTESKCLEKKDIPAHMP